MGGLEFLQGLEDTRLEERQEIIKLGEIVLHRRCGQQQQEALVESVHQLVALACTVAQVMRLIDDDEIEIVCQQALGVLAAARLCDRCDQAFLAPECVGIAAQQRIVGSGTRNIELGLKLFPPLPDQRRRRQHQHALHHAAQQILLEHHAGLDGLAEADFVGEQHTAAELLEHLADGLDLIPEGFDAMQVGQA